MKKTVIILAAVITILSINKNSEVIIPEDSIRFRVIANSNTHEDQNLKKKIIKNLNDNINNLLTYNTNFSNSRENIKNSISSFEEVVKKTIEENNTDTTYTINYGMNYFPEKEYKGTVYKEGTYESLVITLGNGNGNNFWCVLFPPLCLLEAEDGEDKTEVEYKSFVKEIIDKYF